MPNTALTVGHVLFFGWGGGAVGRGGGGACICWKREMPRLCRPHHRPAANIRQYGLGSAGPDAQSARKV